MLIIICGLPGSGKTTLASELARALGAIHLSSDSIRRQLYPKPQYSEAEKRAVYLELARLAEEALRGGKTVVADATFSRQTYRKIMLELAKRTVGTKPLIVFCQINGEEAKVRLSLRPKGDSDADFEIHKKLREEFEPLGENEGEILKFNPTMKIEDVKEWIKNKSKH